MRFATANESVSGTTGTSQRACRMSASGGKAENICSVDLPGADIVQQLLKIGTIGGPAGVPSIVISGADQGPASMGLAFDIGRGGVVLRVQRVELLVETMLGGDTGIDRTADPFDRRTFHDAASTVDRSSLSRRPKKRGPLHLVPVIASATLERLAYV